MFQVKTKAQKLVVKAKKKQKLSLDKMKKADLNVISKCPEGNQSGRKIKKTSPTQSLSKSTKKVETATVTPSKKVIKLKEASASPLETPRKTKTSKVQFSWNCLL